MFRFRIGLADAETKSEFSVEFGVGEEEIAAAVEAIHDGLIGGISGFMTKTNQIQRDGRCEFEVFVIVMAHPIGELLRQFHMAANVVLQTLHAVMADHEPELERAEAATELDVPVSIVDYCSRFRGLIA